MDFSEKITSLIIGKSANPRCFKGINSFPTKYRSNKKAWMTTELFNEWLVQLNSDMKREKRHILLFLDNCTVHNNAPPLSNVKLQFFPPNSTSKLQPLDQGFPSPNLVDGDNTLTEFNAEPSLWKALPLQDFTFDDFVLVDTDISVWGALSDAEIGALNHNNTEIDEDE
ncbi:tigger transposable element-derived protein 6 [Trichonephila clavipes]|nr:tigger transposable element-derived protein 6 [Trichonephila clavipes]